MLAFLRREAKWYRRVWGLVSGKARQPSKRKLRLFACSCCRRGNNLAYDQALRDAVETSERFADGLADIKELAAADGQIRGILGGAHLAAGAWVASLAVW